MTHGSVPAFVKGKKSRQGLKEEKMKVFLCDTPQTMSEATMQNVVLLSEVLLSLGRWGRKWMRCGQLSGR